MTKGRASSSRVEWATLPPVVTFRRRSARSFAPGCFRNRCSWGGNTCFTFVPKRASFTALIYTYDQAFH
eukprot:10699162-Prorocentrum_lima.AAC.1